MKKRVCRVVGVVVLIGPLVIGCSKEQATPKDTPASQPIAAAKLAPPIQPATRPLNNHQPVLDVTVDQLDTMITGGANGPDDIKRAVERYRGTQVVVHGALYESSSEVKTIRLKGRGKTYVNCQFDEGVPRVPKKGTPMTLQGIISGFFIEPTVDHCTVAAQAQPSAEGDALLLIKNVEIAVIKFQTDNPQPCPSSLEDLVARKYLQKIPVDPWGERLLFKCPSQHDPADIISKGPDRTAGTKDDIRNWDH